MGEHYQNMANLAAWQIDNEVEAGFCCCDSCAEKLREWLKEKYGSLEAVNQAYHNEVWSGSYSAWSQVHPPLGDRPVTQYNPAYMLDYQRFMSDSTIDYVKDVYKRQMYSRFGLNGSTFVTVQAGLRIHCANREKMWRQQASAPRRRRLLMGGCSNSSAKG